MRFIVKVKMPVEAGNEAARNGFTKLPQILEEQKPEAAYFYAEDGMRTALLIMNLEDASELPKIAEPWFLAVNGALEAYPAMVAEDLQKAGPDIQAAVEKYG